ncbi:Ubiquitin-conjugating enzyme E2 protein [Raphanus sativus]|nr:Ubiquitin-conjugating enzyme E2 protein [Raphanus sativus]
MGKPVEHDESYLHDHRPTKLKRSGVFQLAFAVPEPYPLQPPQVRFSTKIFHPNVHLKTGEICLHILKNAWSSAWTLHMQKCFYNFKSDFDLLPLIPKGNLLRFGDSREMILRTLLSKEKTNDLDFHEIWQMTEGYIGSDLKERKIEQKQENARRNSR